MIPTLRRSRRSPATGTLALSLLLASCDGGPGVDEGALIDSVTVTPATATVDVGATRQLTAVVLNRRGEVVDTTVTWVTDDALVATVSPSGTVTGVAEGSVTVTASVAGESGSAAVTVNDPRPPGPPSDARALTVSHTSIEVSWTDASDNEDEFRVQREEVASAGASSPAAGRAAGQGFVLAGTVAAGVTTFRDDGLEPGTTYRYRVLACNENGCSDASEPTGEVATFAVLALGTASLPDGVVGRSYEAALSASGGDGGYAWETVAGSLPDGLSLDQVTGILRGTPTAPGTSTFTIRVTSGDGQTAEGELSVTVNAVLEITTTELPGGETGVSYQATLSAAGGGGSVTWSVVSGSLPEGLTLNADAGRITGIPAADGDFGFAVAAAAEDGQTDQQALSIAVVVGPVTVTTTSLPDGEFEASYFETLAAAGGDGTFTWAVTSGSLPHGLALDEVTGTISGTATAIETSAFTVEVTSAGRTDEKALSIAIRPAEVRIDTEYLVVGYPGSPYSDFVEVSGGDGGYGWAVTGGSLPGGLALDPTTGEIAGTAASPGAYYFTVTVESAGETDLKTYALAVSTKPAGAFNMGIMNVAGNALPDARLVEELSDVLARWESVITGDLEDESYPEGFWSPDPTNCGGQAPGLNGGFIDDMVVMVALANIDGPGGTLGRAGPCVVRIPTEPPDVNTVFGRLILDTSDLDDLDDHQVFSLFFHEIGHVVGLGPIWRAGSIFQSGSDLISGAGGPDPRYEGAGGNGVFTGTLGGGSQGAAKIPIEADGGSGTRDGHWDEGEFDHEIMTGFAEPSGKEMPISSMTIAAVGDLAYTVDTGAADPYALPVCAPFCGAPPPPAAAVPGAYGVPLDDILDDPVWVVRPDGTVRRVVPGRLP